MKRNFIFAFASIGVLAGLLSCSKDNTSGRGTLQVHLTDAPANYDQVLIDVQDVQIQTSNGNSEGAWQSLSVNKGVYNLLDFRNGLDTLLGSIQLPAGSISQMRLVLGSNNQLKIGEHLYSLDTPSAQQSGLKFNINATITEGITYDLWIDFDASRSIVERGNGTYSLKPVIRTFTKATSGAIKGVVSPVAAKPYVFVVSASDTIGAIVDTTGKFILSGVPAGTYSVKFNPTDAYVAKSVDNVAVTLGNVTAMDTVFISKKQ